MSLFVRFFAVALLTALAPTTAQAIEESIDVQAGEFALERYRDARRLIEGPREIPLPVIDTAQSCGDLYRRRVTLRRHLDDYKPPYWSDPRNQTAVFLGTIWTPAFYFLGYSAVSAHLDQLTDANPRAELDALSQASAQQRCFEK